MLSRVSVVWGVAAYLIHSVGNHAGLYVEYGWYQNLTHACSASAMAALVAVVGRHRGLSGRRLVGFVIALSAVSAVSWEAVEFLGVFPNLHFWGVRDSLLDLTSDALGVLTVLVVLRTRLRPAVDPTAETPSLSALVGPVDGERGTGRSKE